WITEGLRAMADGADIACGCWASAGDSTIERLIQAPYDSMFANRKRGDPIGVNGRNTAIRRGVFAAVAFDPRYGPGGGTGLGPHGKPGRVPPPPTPQTSWPTTTPNRPCRCVPRSKSAGPGTLPG